MGTICLEYLHLLLLSVMVRVEVRRVIGGPGRLSRGGGRKSMDGMEQVRYDQ